MVLALNGPRIHSASLRTGVTMADTYKPGETVPKDGRVRCTQDNGVEDNVKKGTTFAPCDHWGQHHGKGCTWQYI
jgi:hypothetical protein